MSDYLPPEIWEKIFQRLPVKTLLICMSVCKDWKFLITHQYFIQRFANTNISLFLQFRGCLQQSVSPGTQNRFDKVFSIYSDHHEDQLANQLSISKLALTDQAIDFNNFFVIGTCNGLVCLSDYASLPPTFANFILINPFINKYVVLPKSSYGSLESSNLFDGACTSSGFCFDSKNNDFLVVKVVLYYTKSSPPWVELYSHNTGKWRSLIGTGPSLRFSVWGITSDQVFVNGALHWLVCGQHFGRNRYVTIILSFDLATETFGELILPRCLEFRSDIDFSLLKGANSLALVHKNDASIFYIWVMKEYGNVDSWNMIFSFDLTRHGHIERVIGMRNSGELVLERRDNEVIFLDPKKDLVRRSGLEGYEVGFAGDIEESLFLINEKNNASLISRLVL